MFVPRVGYVNQVVSRSRSVRQPVDRYASVRHLRSELNISINQGAGWGGCGVSLVAEDQVEIFIKKIKDDYPPYKGLKEEQLNDVIFATKPGSGACGMCFLRFLRL